MSAHTRIGHTYDPVEYQVTREAIDAYVAAVEEDAGVFGEIAPPMFVVVYCAKPFEAGLFDPELEIDFARLVHGAQEFTWPGPVVRAGDTIATTMMVDDVRATAGLTFYVFRSDSRNQRGERVAEGIWTTIVRGEG